MKSRSKTESGDLQKPEGGVWPIDGRGLWHVARCVQMFFTVPFAVELYDALRHRDWFLATFAFLALGLLTVYFHRFVTGRVSESGISFCRYFVTKAVGWADIQRIEWQGIRLCVVTSQGRLNRKLVFLLNPFQSWGPYLANRLGRDAELPLILERIHALQGEGKPLVSVPARPKWVVRLFFGIGALFLIAVLTRFVIALLDANH